MEELRLRNDMHMQTPSAECVDEEADGRSADGGDDALWTLRVALDASFREDVRLLERVGASFGAALHRDHGCVHPRDTNTHCKTANGQSRQLLLKKGAGDGGANNCRAVDGPARDQDESTLVQQPVPAQGIRSMQRQWEEVQVLLASLPRVTGHRQRDARRPRMTARGKHDGSAQSFHAIDESTKMRFTNGISVLRTAVKKRRHSRPLVEHTDAEVTRHVINAWRRVVRARRETRERVQLAEAYRRQRYCLVAFRRWRQYQNHCRLEEGIERRLTERWHLRVTKTAFQYWWCKWHLVRAGKLLCQVHNRIIVKRSLTRWLRYFTVARDICSATTRARRQLVGRCLNAILLYKDRQKIVKRLHEHVRIAMQGRIFRVMVTHATNCHHQRIIIDKAAHFHARNVFMRVFDAWCLYVDARTHVQVAITWRIRALTSTSFESWILFWNANRWRRQRRAIALRFRMSQILEVHVHKWKEFIAKRQSLRHLLTSGIEKGFLLGGFRQWAAFSSDLATRERCLLTWKQKRCAHKWHVYTETRQYEQYRRNTVTRLVQKGRIHRCAWAQWRTAFRQRICVRQLQRKTRQRSLQWRWTQWREFVSRHKMKRVVLAYVDAEWAMRRKLQTVKRWYLSHLNLKKRRHTEQQSDLHFRRRVLVCTFEQWKLKATQQLFKRVKCAQADRHFLKLQVRRWVLSTVFTKRNIQIRMNRVIARLCYWESRRHFNKWKYAVKTSAQDRLISTFARWQDFTRRITREHVLNLIGTRLRTRKCWYRWNTRVSRRQRLEDMARELAHKRDQRILNTVFFTAWRFKVSSYSRARQVLHRFHTSIRLTRTFKRWAVHAHRRSRYRQAIAWSEQRLQVACFHQLYSYTITRPFQVLHTFVCKIKLKIFNQWNSWVRTRRSFHQNTQRLVNFRIKQTVTRWMRVVSTAKKHERQAGKARLLHDMRLKRFSIEQWVRLVDNSRKCGEARCVIHKTQLDRSFRSWKRAFSQRTCVRDIVTRINSECLKKSWNAFVGVIVQLKRARREWRQEFSRIHLRKCLMSWRGHAVAQHGIRARVARMKARLIRDTLFRSLATWIHFVALRSVIAMHSRRAARRLCERAYLSWKVFSFRARCRRAASQTSLRLVFDRLRRHTLIREAFREVEMAHGVAQLRLMWAAWRVEFWVRCSQGKLAAGCLRFSLERWKAYRDTKRRQNCLTGGYQQLHGARSEGTIRGTCRTNIFNDAVVVQYCARNQRAVMTKILHGWLLAAKTRQRRRQRL